MIVQQGPAGGIKDPPDQTLDEAEYYQTVMVKFLQHAFYTLPANDPLRWVPDSTVSRLEIMASPPQNADVVARNPIIVVYLGPISDYHDVIGDLASFQFSTGRTTRVKRRNAYYTLYCTSKNPIVCRRIANLARTFIESQQAMLEGDGGFFQIGRTPGFTENPVSPPGAMIPGDPKGLLMLGLNVPAVWQWGFTSTPARGLPGDWTIRDILRASDPSQLTAPGIGDVHTVHVQLNRSAEYSPDVRRGALSAREIVAPQRGIADLIIAPRPKET